MAIKVVIFDCDGVLFDSTAANTAYYSHLAEAFGRGPLSEAEKQFVHVHTVFDSVAHVFRHQPDLIPEVHRLREKVGYGPYFGLMIPRAGVYECLDALSQKYILAILTNRSNTIGPVLDFHKMSHYFKAVVSILDVQRPKPDAEGVIKILEAVGAEPAEAVYVGDAPSDALTARNAGIHFIAYKNPAIKDAAAIDHFRQLPPLLARL